MGIVATGSLGQRRPAGWLQILAFSWAVLAGVPALAQVQRERADYAPGNLEFQIPDKWSVETSKQKLTLVAPDEDGFVQFSPLQAGTDAQLRAQVAQALTTYLSDTVLADPGDMTEVNGMPAFRVSGSASSDATPVQFLALVVSSTPSRPVLVLAYAAQDSFAAYTPVFEALIKSLKRR